MHEAHAGEPTVPRHPKSTYAAETPCTDGQRLYVLFGDVGLYCYDFDGNLLWSHQIEPKKTFFDYGAAASPPKRCASSIAVRQSAALVRSLLQSLTKLWSSFNSAKGSSFSRASAE